MKSDIVLGEFNIILDKPIGKAVLDVSNAILEYVRVLWKEHRAES